MLPNKPSLPAFCFRLERRRVRISGAFLLSPDNRISLVVTVFSFFFLNSIPPSLAGDGLCNKLNANYDISVGVIVGGVVRMLGYEVQL